MKRSNRLVLLIGIFLAIVAFILIIAVFPGGGGGGNVGPTPSPTTTKVVVASKDIALGTTIQADQVDLKDIEILDRPATAIGSTTLVVGQVARSNITAGQLITIDLISDTGSIGRLEVPPGKVGMAVRVNQTSGVGTIIKAGDYVDAVVGFNIVPTYTDPVTGLPKKVDIEGGLSVKALLQSMQVLGTLLPTPTATQEPQPQPSGAPTQGGSASTSLNGQEQIVILAVDLQQAEVLNYAQTVGVTPPNGITLVLRSSKDFQDAAGSPSVPPDVLTTGIILKILVEKYGVLPPFDIVLPSPTPKR